MSVFIGSNAGETITPDTVSSSVKVAGHPKKPSAASDLIFAGGGNDTVAGGAGNDLAFLGSGDDTFIWNGGDGNDVVLGDSGFDTLKFNGADLNETIELSSAFFGAVAVKSSAELQGQKLSSNLVLESMERVEIAALDGVDSISIKNLSGTALKEVAIDLAAVAGGTSGDGALDQITAEGTSRRDVVEIADQANAVSVTGLPTKLAVANADATDTLTIKTGAGNDSIDASGLAADKIQLELLGGDGADSIIGSAGADLIVGGRGDDTADMGDGDDTFVWNPGEGSDVVEGGDGYFDAMDFVGNGANENVDISANGERVRFFRDVANVTMDLHGVERILFSSLGGTDNIHVGDLKGTGIENVTVEMSTTRDSLAGDGAKDVVTVDGSADDDSIDVEFANGVADVNLFHNFVNLLGIEAGDQIVVNAGAGDDLIAALNVKAGAPILTLDGGAGDDVILGGDTNETMIGGDGNDIIDGNRGSDIALMGAGDDRFIWDPGEGSDVVEGGDGFDTMDFNGANVAEDVTISANGDRTTFFRNPGNITMDLNDVEQVFFNALGGADNIVMKPLDGFDVLHFDINLAGEQFGTSGDGAVDTITVEGTSDGDVMSIGGEMPTFSVGTGGAYLGIHNAEATDKLVLATGAGDDMIIAHPFAGGIDLTLDGGEGDDFIQGSQGAESILGGTGDDYLEGNDGNDVIDGGDGVDMLFGGAGDDLFVNGEIIQDFVAGAGSEDRIDLRGLGLTFDSLLDHASDTSDGVLFDLGELDLTLTDVTKDMLHQDDFLLA